MTGLFSFQAESLLTNQMWFSMVCTLINNDTRHQGGHNVVDSSLGPESAHVDELLVHIRLSLQKRLQTHSNLGAIRRKRLEKEYTLFL